MAGGVRQVTEQRQVQTAPPEDFIRHFIAFWTARDAARLAHLLAEDADVLTLTGAWCEGRVAAEATLRAELTGAFARSRLVTGRMRLQPLPGGAVVLHQRFVLSGMVDAAGQNAGQVAALLTAVLRPHGAVWQAVSLHFTGMKG
ncbi:DUF4440 domain-containing protein [Fertoebacter nigrum]|uniref:DUF4440 domain-containing protein n=1 Tax=Fertoeibacter niger TaxID=2656921 RepID=A0A8X8KQ76_9RHOB|nr:DUF4440 domain-containing protein [Fertoeibacter niger]NUB43762.1 DUF4440 domain-containing protein [Fertoeibacter niger]